MADQGLWREQDGLIPSAWIGPGRALALLALVAALLLTGIVAVLNPPPEAKPRPGSDLRLYIRMIEDVSKGEPYYTAAPRELRQAGYPLRPFMAVRPPLLTVTLARLPDATARYAALGVLAALTFAAWGWRIYRLQTGLVRFGCALVVLASGVLPVMAPMVYAFHEAWAGLLIALSLALYGRRTWGLSLALGLAAALVRELAVPYLLVMALFALVEGRRGEAAAWVAAMAIFAVFLARHAAAASAVALPSDLRSPGWLGLGGWRFVLGVTEWNVFVWIFATGLPALMLPPALLGLLNWPGGFGRRTAFVVFGFVGGFCFVGRPDNTYWGLMIAPLWPLGLMQAGGAFASLAKRAKPFFGRRSVEASHAA